MHRRCRIHVLFSSRRTPSREPSTDVFLKRCGLLREELAPTPDGATPKCGEMYVDTAENDADGVRVAELMRRREDLISQHDEVVIVAEPVLQLFEAAHTPVSLAVDALDEPQLIPVIFDTTPPLVKPHVLGLPGRRFVHRRARAAVSPFHTFTHRAAGGDRTDPRWNDAPRMDEPPPDDRETPLSKTRVPNRPVAFSAPNRPL